MNSLLSIHYLAGKNKLQSISLGSATAINGGVAISPYTGTFTWDGNTYTEMYVFTSTSGPNSISLPSNKTVGVLLVGGGAGSGNSLSNYSGIAPGGGGGGGVVRGRISLNGSTTYNIAIGVGGTRGLAPTANTNPGNAVPPTNGGDTIITGSGVSEKAFGGGAGSYNNGQMANSTLQQGTNNGKNGGCGGGAHYTWSTGGVGGSTTQTQANASTSTNTRTLTYMGNAGGTRQSASTGTGGGGASTAGTAGTTTNGAVASLGGTGYLFNVTGTTNSFTGKYYATGGCGGNLPTIICDQSSIVSVGGVVGGTTANPTPPMPTTYGTGASGPVADFNVAPPAGYYGQHGQNGMQGICIILVP